MRLTLKELELLNTASAYNGEQHKAICGKAALELIEYKKIEEELGIDLITLFKALKQGIWIKIDFDFPPMKAGLYFIGIGTKFEYCKVNNLFTIHIGYLTIEYELKDYGKTWALDKNDLTK